MKIITEYAVSVNNSKKLPDIPYDEIKFTIDDALFLDTILLKIKGKTIRFCGKEKKKQNDKEQELINEIEKLESDQTLCNLHTLIEDKKAELHKICNIKLKGNMVLHTMDLWRWAPTKYSCALETKKILDKTIKKVLTDKNEIITDQKEILTSTSNLLRRAFQKSWYWAQSIKHQWTIQKWEHKKLNDNAKASIEGELTLTEIGISLNQMKNDKSPGLDGFTAEFFKFFWIKLKYFILCCINHSYKLAKLPQTLRTFVVTCLPKQNKSREQLITIWDQSLF